MQPKPKAICLDDCSTEAPRRYARPSNGVGIISKSRNEKIAFEYAVVA